MDPLAQRMLEKAQMRSRNYGVTDVSRLPLTESAGTGAASNTSTTDHYHQPKQKSALPIVISQATANTTASTATSTSTNRLQVIERTQTVETTRMMNAQTTTPTKVMRQFSAVDKENMDLGIEINITTDKNIEVEVQVEEQELSDNGDYDDVDGGERDYSHRSQMDSREMVNQPLARIRDTSRNRLQRLGALYSNTADLSSPIHRTEGNFHAGSNDDDAGLGGSPKKPKQRYDKLAALASSINEWEDDLSHPTHAHVEGLVPPPKPDLPSRRLLGKKKSDAPPPPSPLTRSVGDKTGKTEPSASSSGSGNGKTKQLKWDPKVIDSLEAQGFQRRESSTVKLAYEYDCEAEQQEQATAPSTSASSTGTRTAVGQIASAFAREREVVNAAKKDSGKDGAGAGAGEKKVSHVKPGLVSGRAAAFESKVASSKSQGPPQKDPAELSLKERMKLFEKNKGQAPIPKAPFGQAPPITKLRLDAFMRKDDVKAPATTSTTATSTATATLSQASGVGAVVKTGSECKVRDKVAALVANATISETKIREQIQKQRDEDMQVLANRFNKQKTHFAKEHADQHQPASSTTAAASVVDGRMRPPPPPPPPPPSVPTATVPAKRRSPGDAIEDESKRPKKTEVANRLYPALSDLELNASSSDNDQQCTTATVSGRSTADDTTRIRGTHLLPSRDADIDDDEDDDEENNSYMESDADDSSATDSLGREIMRAVKRNDQPHHHQQQPLQKHSHRHLQQEDHTQRLQHHQQQHSKHLHHNDGGDSSMNSSEDASCLGVDDYLDEALGEHDDDDITQEESGDDHNASHLSAGSKGTTASNSFSFRKVSMPQKQHHQGQSNISEDAEKSTNRVHFAQPVKSELSVNQEDDNNMVTLVHTVSFYRRQQNANSANSTPVRKICREQQVLRSAVEEAASAALHFEPHSTPKHTLNDSDDMSFTETDDAASDHDDGTDEAEQVQNKIKQLLDEVCKQQQVIAQTSQALNLCAATIEFSGSTESVEGERHLLVATHRRQACLDEVQRLRVEKSVRPLGAPKEKGRLTVKEITVPLRKDYIRKLATDTISGHQLVCLLKYNEHVLATKTVPTLPGLLAVKFPDVLQLNNVYADFRITLEIYGMTAQREALPHEVKYHINMNKKSGIKTPKKKGVESRLIFPPVQSPGGPHVVRTPALVQYGFAIFSLREIQRTTWSLTQVLSVSPLEGILHMKVNCELSVSVEYKGFLTMFEDISGFGAWHRRWCHLNGTMLNYWKYPDDEKKKTPMGSIDLYTCISQKVSTAPRDVCARLNTILLECERPAKENDQESLIIVPNGRTTIVRCLLSADTKEEREEWCAYFNKALTLLRAWGPPQ